MRGINSLRWRFNPGVLRRPAAIPGQDEEQALEGQRGQARRQVAGDAADELRFSTIVTERAAAVKGGARFLSVIRGTPIQPGTANPSPTTRPADD